jgi:hypothetical protein
VRTFTPRQNISQVRIDNEEGILMWGLDDLAKESKVEVTPVFPIFVVLVNDRPIAYYYAQPQVVIRPTVSPDALSPREFYEVAKVVIATTKRIFGNPLWLIDDKSVLANPELLAKLGLNDLPLKPFEVD